MIELHGYVETANEELASCRAAREELELKLNHARHVAAAHNVQIEP